MKQKKIIVPILTLAVMLLMVGGVYAVFSSTQPEKSKAEKAARVRGGICRDAAVR